MTTYDSGLQKSEDVVYRDVGEGAGVLLHVKSGQYHGLNETGAFLWRLIDGTRTIDDIVAELREAVDEPPSQLRRDVEAFIESMRERDLLAR